jgi:hypothetical protein
MRRIRIQRETKATKPSLEETPASETFDPAARSSPKALRLLGELEDLLEEIDEALGPPPREGRRCRA